MNATTSWETLLRTPRPCDHLIQLYTDEAFLAQAVAQFVGRGLAEGAAAVVIATPAHVDAFIARLAAGGLDVPEIVRRGQLVVRDAEGCLATFMVDGMPDRAAFFRLVRGLFDGVRAAGHMSIRVLGEMVNLLWDHNLEATVRLEELWNEVLADQRVSLLCAYRIDNFDRHAHRGVLHQISRVHSHLIPLEDYSPTATARPGGWRRAQPPRGRAQWAPLVPSAARRAAFGRVGDGAGPAGAAPCDRTRSPHATTVRE
jgi:hypothetical protein